MRRLHADLNLTPLIDVLLVLIVIFLVALPLTRKSLDTSLPVQAETTPAASMAHVEDVVLQYNADGRLSINQHDVTLPELEERLKAIYDTRQDKTMYIIGAPSLRYKAIINVIDAAKGAGVERVGIVTEGMRRAAGVSPAGN